MQSKWMIAGCWAGVVHVGVSVALAQVVGAAATRRRPAQVSQVDLYGNATASAPLRNELDVFQNSAQRRVLDLYQEQGRRLQQRGGLLPFSLPADVYRRNQLSRNTAPMLPYVASSASRRSASRRVQAFRDYGGFAARAPGKEVNGMQRVFARRYDLIAATSNAAPVFRANMRHASVAGMLNTIDTTPFDQRGADLTEPAKTRLVDVLAEDVEQSHQRLMREAWDWFREGKYRRAMRSFESADMLGRGDFTSKVGLFFSLMQLGSVRAAHTVMLEINRRDPNPFLHAINVADVLGDSERVALLRSRAEVASDAPARNPDVAAMHVLVTWYLGNRSKALAVARAISEKSPGSPFDEWPEKMKAAMEAEALPTP